MSKRNDPWGYRSGVAAGIVAAAALALSGCGGSSDAATNASGSGSSSGGGGSSTQLALVGYSTPKKAYGALTSAFGQTSEGKGVGFSQSFGASGSQSRAVDSGQPADVCFHGSALRPVGTVHCVVAFFFNASLLALSINVAAGMLL